MRLWFWLGTRDIKKTKSSKKRNCDKDNEVGGQIGKDALSRCSRSYFLIWMKQIRPKLVERKHEKIEKI